ncbi:MAG TPA: hypothetical protein VKZ77_06850 [Bacillaceae bacterium]|nr:hypothetical protein [Bacillaceae bacterium]
MQRNFTILICIISILLLVGCTIEQTSLPPSTHPLKDNSISMKKIHSIIPINITKDQFERVYGWLDNHHILYSFTSEGKYILNKHNIMNGETNVIFTSESPIVNVLIHESKEQIFVHTSPNGHLAQVYFMDNKGEITFETAIESFELAYEWNDFNPNIMLTTAFYEDWTFKVHKINVSNQQMEEIDNIQPFYKWLSEEDILIQSWAEDEMSFFAPLIRKSLNQRDDSSSVMQEVFRYDTFSDTVMVITVSDEIQSTLQYSFYTQDFSKLLFELSIPSLTQYSDWQVPYYDFVSTQSKFLTFAPLNHGSVDLYTDGYNLISLDLVVGEDVIVFENMENKPLSCSPDGLKCLYGFELEEVLDLQKGIRISLIK